MTVVESSRQNCLQWFSGKALENARKALDLLAECEAAGYWLPGTKRKIDACLPKTNLTANLATKHEHSLVNLGSFNNPEPERGWRVFWILKYGAWRYTSHINWPSLRSKTSDPILLSLLDTALHYVSDFVPLTALALELDAVSPKPQVTTIGASPTVTKTLAEIGLHVKLDTIRPCPVTWRKIASSTTEDGQPRYSWIGILEWPENTVHDRSSHADPTGHHLHCHACGHSIKNHFNWVPILVDQADGTPLSLWVGRDCAQTLFGVRVSNDFILEDSR